MDRILTAKRLLLPDGELDHGAALVQNGRISAVGRAEEFLGVDLPRLEYGGQILSPGFFDLHIHGCMGRVADESEDAVKLLAGYLPQTGTTSFLATAMTARGCKHAAGAIAAQKAGKAPGAVIRGIYMEGPFLSPRNLAGAEGVDQDILAPSIPALEEILATGCGNIRIMGLGVELDGAKEVMRALKSRGIVVSAAHTKAEYADILAAKANGLTHATHLYNVMSGLHHRRPGVVGAVLTSDDITTELICDGVHLHPAAIDAALRCKGSDRIAMITDMTLGGLPDGDYDNGTVQIEVRDNIARFKGVDPEADHAIVGSTRPMLNGIQTVAALGYPLYEAVKMASLTPAKIAGLDDETGSIAVGKSADFAVFDEAFSPVMTMVRGEIAFERA
ncbi:MAG TPA: N-acetylglucosamine-6-phosphate deacetylase [Feifaniaceae bacterium]|nr:N-acetylglucosamine-6-phosphate deacetylase [Feifaniaceae bacterium]